MIEASKRGWLMPCRMVWWWTANFSLQSYTILTRSYITPRSLTLSLKEKEKKDACEACVRSTSFPRFSSSREGERTLRKRLVQGDLSWPSLSMKKTQLLCKCVLELKAVLYFSADLYLITQTIRGNHDWNSRDRRGQMFFPFPAVAASVPSF